MSIHSTGLGADEPLAVSTKKAMMLLDCERTHLYNLLSRGELKSYKDGQIRKILFSSIKDYVARRLEAAK
jgi:excisionase family DNA binding protein